MPPVRTASAEVYASHHQFYVVAPGHEHDRDVWDGAALERHLGVAPGVVAVGTIGYTVLPVTIEVWAAEPPLDLDASDHVTEASLDVPLGSVELHEVEGPAELEPLVVEAGTYRVRVCASGLDGADEAEGGDRYLVQLWLAPAQEPEVVKWWPPWNPTNVAAERTTPTGRIFVGAEAEDRRRGMTWLASRGSAHLFRDGDGELWEHSNLRDARGTPQLEELSAEEAASRYGWSDTWGASIPTAPGPRALLRNVLQTLEYYRGRRPPPEPQEVVVDERRILLGGAAVTRIS